MDSLRILHVTAEISPFAKTGGLADVVAGLTAALAGQGHDVRVLLPAYFPDRPPHASVSLPGSRQHTIDGPAGPISFGFRQVERSKFGAGIYLLDSPSIRETGAIYADDPALDGRRFLTLCHAVIPLIDELDWIPDVIHCHDWHTGAIPRLLRSVAQSGLDDIGTVLTIHNIGYQGTFPARQCSPSEREALGIGDVDMVNMLELGIRSADRLTTVSPTHAKEVLTSEYGMGLETLLGERRDLLTGILNGADYTDWDPSRDEFITQRYDRREPAGKRACVRALAAEFGLAPDPVPLAGVVSRLAAQKGMDFILSALPSFLAAGSLRAVVLGDGDPELVAELHALAARFPNRMAFVAGHDNALAHRIYAGSDLFLVPSRYEPCGLTQIYAMRYGAVPVVRKTGGLADTVTHFDAAGGTGTGSVFEHADAQGLSWAIGQVLGWNADDGAWKTVVNNAMAANYSWEHQAPKYVDLYERVAGGDAEPA